MDALEVVFRWLHIFGGIIIVGGLLFIRFGLVPAAGVLNEPDRTKFRENVRLQWARWVHLSVAMLFVSGIWNVANKEMTYKLDMWYRGFWSVKFLLALVVMGIISVYMGKSQRAVSMREKPNMWLNSLIGMAVVIVAISGLLRTWEYPKKDRSANPPVEAFSVDSLDSVDSLGSSRPGQ